MRVGKKRDGGPGRIRSIGVFYKQVVAELRAGLTELYHAPDGYQVALGDGGATLFWDAAACCLVRNRAACGVFGAFSNKFAVEDRKSDV